VQISNSIRMMTNVLKLPDAKETQQTNERRADAYMNSETDIRDLAIKAALARHLHFKELEDGSPISPAGTPLIELLESIDTLAQRMWLRFREA
jgi:hypothetical protein